MLDKLDQYGIDDPNTDDRVGAYTGEDYREYFTDKYIQLVESGKISFLDALYVGALIEELDMSDIVNCLVIIQEVKELTASQCGLVYTDERRLIRSYDNLLEGSENHLLAYVQMIEQEIGVGNCEAQYLTQVEVDEILGRWQE